MIPGYLDAVSKTDADEVRVIDNGSEPRLDLPGCTVFRLPGNVGFSRACNFGLRQGRAHAVCFLNNDIRATGSGNWLQPIREALRPGILVGASLCREPNTNTPYLDGWCFAGMRDDLLAIGGFDEAYEEPAYFSDCDLGLRAKAAGMRLVQVDVPLRHLGNYTTRRISVADVSARNRERYQKRVQELAVA